MFCPDCGGEYRSGFSRCADFTPDLVEHLPVSRLVAVNRRELAAGLRAGRSRLPRVNELVTVAREADVLAARVRRAMPAELTPAPTPAGPRE